MVWERIHFCAMAVYQTVGVTVSAKDGDRLSLRQGDGDGLTKNVKREKVTTSVRGWAILFLYRAGQYPA